MSLSVNEAKLTENCATFQLVLIFWNLPSGPKRFRAFRETGPGPERPNLLGRWNAHKECKGEQTKTRFLGK